LPINDISSRRESPTLQEDEIARGSAAIQSEPVSAPHVAGPVGIRSNPYVRHRYLVLMFLPAVVYYAVFAYAPLYGIQIAFKSYLFREGIWRSPWVGLENFTLLFSQPSFWQVLRNTVLISLYKLVFNFPAPILLALLINELPFARFKKVTQTITYLPHFISWVVLGGLFLQLLSPSAGPVNIVIKALGLKPVYFLADPAWFRGTLVATALWKEIGWSSIIYLAAIASINPELYEAAIVDGASRFRRALSITLPSLAPVITVLLIFALQGIIGDDFDQIFNLYNPSVYKVGDVLGTFVYRMGLLNMQYSYATAVGLFRNVIAFGLLVFANAASRRSNEYGIW